MFAQLVAACLERCYNEKHVSWTFSNQEKMFFSQLHILLLHVWCIWGRRNYQEASSPLTGLLSGGTEKLHHKPFEVLTNATEPLSTHVNASLPNAKTLVTEDIKRWSLTVMLWWLDLHASLTGLCVEKIHLSQLSIHFSAPTSWWLSLALLAGFGFLLFFIFHLKKILTMYSNL